MKYILPPLLLVVLQAQFCSGSGRSLEGGSTPWKPEPHIVQLVQGSAQELLKLRGATGVLVVVCASNDGKAVLHGMALSGSSTRVLVLRPAFMGRGDLGVSTVEAMEESIRGLQPKVGVFLDSTCPGAAQILSRFSELRWFNASFAWLIWSEEEEGVAARMFDDLDMAVDCDVTLATPNGKLTDVHKLDYSKPVRVTSAGFWQGSNVSYPLPTDQLAWRSDLTGIFFYFSVVHLHGFRSDQDQQDVLENTTIEENDSDDVYIKKAHRIFRLTQEMFNYSYSLKYFDDVGGRLPNGSFTGLLGSLHRKEIMSSSISVRLLPERVHAFKYIAPSELILKLSFNYRMPRAVDSPVGMVRPFSTTVWASLGLMLILWMVTFRAVHAAEVHLSRSVRQQPSDDALKAVATLASQGVEDGLVGSLWSGRCSFLTATFFSLLIAAFYSSQVVKFLIVADNRGELTYDDMLRSMTFVSEEWFYYRYLFTHAKDPKMLEIKRRHLDNEDNWVKIPEGVKRLRKGRTVFISDALATAEVFAQQSTPAELCSLRSMEFTWTGHLYFLTARNWPYTEFITRGMRMARERGFVTRIAARYQRPRCHVNSADLSGLGLFSTMVAFGVAAGGLACALLLLACEICFWHCSIKP